MGCDYDGVLYPATDEQRKRYKKGTVDRLEGIVEDVKPAFNRNAKLILSGAREFVIPYHAKSEFDYIPLMHALIGQRVRHERYVEYSSRKYHELDDVCRLTILTGPLADKQFHERP